jgi:hypothetical protein
LVAPLVLRETVDVNEDDWCKTEDYVESRQHIEEGADALRVPERNAVASHEPGIEELMHLEGQKGPNDHHRIRMAFMLLYKLLIAFILLHDDKE